MQAWFVDERYDRLPEPMQRAIARGVEGYYETRDHRQVDFAVDAAQQAWRLAASEGLGVVAALVEPGLAPAALLEKIARARRGIREAYDAVIEADTITAVAD